MGRIVGAARVVSVNVGQVAIRTSTRGQKKETGIGKQPVTGLVRIGPEGLEGDGSAYRSRDLGDTAVHIFCLESYDRFQELGAVGVPVPSFGENLTVAGYRETEARVGDVIRVGTALLKVNQPVVRCSWPTVVSGEKRISRWATQEGLTGFYLDVVQPGFVAAGDVLEIVHRGPAGWTIARLNALILDRNADRTELETVLSLPELADRWKGELRERTV